MAKSKGQPARRKKRRPLAVLTADTHLWPLIWQSRPDIRGDAFFGFSQIVNYCCRNGVDYLLIAGDVLDKPVMSAETPYQLRIMLEKLESAGTEILFIQGQHDRQPDSVPWLKALWPSAVHLHKKRTYVGEFPFYGLDWMPVPQLIEELKAIPKDTYGLMLHARINGVNTCAPTSGLCEKHLPGVPLVLIGDEHVFWRQSLWYRPGERVSYAADAATSEEPEEAGDRRLEQTVISPGSTHMRSLSESDIKSFCVLFDDGMIMQRHLRTRIYYSVCLNSNSKLDTILATLDASLHAAEEHAEELRLPEEIRKPIVGLSVQYNATDNIPRIERVIGDRAALIVRPLTSTLYVDRRSAKKKSLPDLAVWPRSPADSTLALLSGLREMFPNRGTVYRFCHELLTAADAQPVIAGWRKKFTGEEEQ